MDVGSIDWPDDFDFGREQANATTNDNVDNTIDAASKLDKLGDWDAAITAYQTGGQNIRPNIANFISERRRKIDAAG